MHVSRLVTRIFYRWVRAVPAFLCPVPGVPDPVEEYVDLVYRIKTDSNAFESVPASPPAFRPTSFLVPDPIPAASLPFRDKGAEVRAVDLEPVKV